METALSARRARRFVSLPPARRFALIVGLGAVAIAAAYFYGRSHRPETVPGDVAERGLAEVREVLRLVEASEFGRSERGAALTSCANRFVEEDRVRFSAHLKTEALYRKEPGRAPVLYISVFAWSRGFVLPSRGELAERIYHEALHAVKRSGRKSFEEECDAFCAAEEARAAGEVRPPVFPLRRDGEILWRWVVGTYKDAGPFRPDTVDPTNIRARSAPGYAPVGRTLDELARKAGIE